MSREGNSNVGNTADVGRESAHPKAALADKPVAPPAENVVGRMVFAVICGGFLGLLLSILFAPDFAIASAIGGAMSFGAGAVVLILMKSETGGGSGQAKDRTDEAVAREK